MLVSPLPDSGYHCQMSQANTEITPASSPLQLNALVWLKECMLYKDMGGEGRRRRAGEDFQQPCRTKKQDQWPQEGDRNKEKEVEDEEWLLVSLAKKERATEGFRRDGVTRDFSGSS